MLKHRLKRDERSARGFGGGRSRRFRPRRRPSGTTGLQIYIPRQTSALMAKLPSSRPAATPQSRCPSDFYVAGRGANLRATLYQATRFFTFPFCQPLRALHPCAQVRRLAEQDAFALPHHPGTCQTSLPNAPHLHLPTLMAKFPSSPPPNAMKGAPCALFACLGSRSRTPSTLPHPRT